MGGDAIEASWHGKEGAYRQGQHEIIDGGGEKAEIAAHCTQEWEASNEIVDPCGTARATDLKKRLLRAAEAGDAGSQCNLGILCDNGMDDNGHAVAGNRRQAVKLLLAAAERGLPRAQIKLAEVYADAPDTSGSHAASGGWFLLAAQELPGVQPHRARSGYQCIASQLNSAQIEQARRFARGWTPKRPKPAIPIGATAAAVQADYPQVAPAVGVSL